MAELQLLQNFQHLCEIYASSQFKLFIDELQQQSASKLTPELTQLINTIAKKYKLINSNDNLNISTINSSNVIGEKSPTNSSVISLSSEGKNSPTCCHINKTGKNIGLRCNEKVSVKYAPYCCRHKISVKDEGGCEHLLTHGKNKSERCSKPISKQSTSGKYCGTHYLKYDSTAGVVDLRKITINEIEMFLDKETNYLYTIPNEVSKECRLCGKMINGKISNEFSSDEITSIIEGNINISNELLTIFNNKQQ